MNEETQITEGLKPHEAWELKEADAAFEGIERPLDHSYIPEIRRVFGDAARTVYLAGERDAEGDVIAGGIMVLDQDGRFLQPSLKAVKELAEADMSSAAQIILEAGVETWGDGLTFMLGLDLMSSHLGEELLELVRDQCHPDSSSRDWAKLQLSAAGEMPMRSSAEGDPYVNMPAAWQAAGDLQDLLIAVGERRVAGESIKAAAERGAAVSWLLGMLEMACADLDHRSATPRTSLGRLPELLALVLLALGGPPTPGKEGAA